MAKRLTQAQKMQKAQQEKITSEILEDQIEAFLNEGGKIDRIESGESGLKPYSFQKTISRNTSNAASEMKRVK